ncbi:hypothetical protein SADUNF_Sadunf14G0011800 [Salix dunnii]|uniref:F-box domain-containing protein n=1 Tax=Salix dunnii TaxID=1413687 RepID=A0A835JF51_9ROSI|nr:hypothetical protein SADUNF_Sadunf14G0011800 [Salix dunnii]
MNLDENLLFEVLKHVDARTLGRASCVSKQWHRTVQDERLWELICTKHWANIGCGNQQLRSVVLALGGFRRLHSQYLWPLSKPQSIPAPSASSSPSAWSPFPQIIGNKPPARWGKDEVHLSLSLLSIRYYEKMNFSNRGRSFKSFSPMINVLLLLLAVSSSFFISEAGPLNVSGAHGSINKEFEFVFDGLYIGRIKLGPSHGGIGNKHTNAQTLGAAINSGPSNGGPGN